ncbi:hypothetical protein PENSUB_901 [Penicillium subrubescens]|uniref:Uncharacterized protein n=1 Tax=Penicillium subrubescens TaxID=1316194 RepID=A0A1Q5ULR8_9EURO|nr:hypothetical protein PENSUB_901 [Penicillium subrubescens]
MELVISSKTPLGPHGVESESSRNDSESAMLVCSESQTSIRGGQLPSPQTDRQALGLIEAFRISIVPVQIEQDYRNSKKE